VNPAPIDEAESKKQQKQKQQKEGTTMSKGDETKK
jgi:hypothetical protein